MFIIKALWFKNKSILSTKVKWKHAKSATKSAETYVYIQLLLENQYRDISSLYSFNQQIRLWSYQPVRYLNGTVQTRIEQKVPSIFDRQRRLKSTSIKTDILTLNK